MYHDRWPIVDKARLWCAHPHLVPFLRASEPQSVAYLISPLQHATFGESTAYNNEIVISSNRAILLHGLSALRCSAAPITWFFLTWLSLFITTPKRTTHLSFYRSLQSGNGMNRVLERLTLNNIPRLHDLGVNISFASGGTALYGIRGSFECNEWKINGKCCSSPLLRTAQN